MTFKILKKTSTPVQRKLIMIRDCEGEDLVSKVTEIARKNKMSISEAARQMLHYALDNMDE